MTDRESLRAAARLLDDASSIVVAGHVGPDGDALGSAVGLALAAREAGKDAVATFGDPFVVPPMYRFLQLDVLVAPNELPEAIDVFVAGDTATVERLGTAAEAISRSNALIVIDHHASNAGFGDVVILDTSAAATAQLVFYLIEELGWKLDPLVATALYTGLVTDTGRFQYSSTNPEVHRVAAELLAAGARPEEVGRHVYEESPFGYLAVAAAVLGRAQLDPDIKLVSSVLYQADLDAAGIGYEDADGLIDALRVARESDVACLLRELDGRTKGSLRSRGEIDVATLAAEFGGGGHHNASGFTYDGRPEAALERIRELLRG